MEMESEGAIALLTIATPSIVYPKLGDRRISGLKTLKRSNLPDVPAAPPSAAPCFLIVRTLAEPDLT